MYIKDAIEILQEEPLNSEIIVAYWNKETIEHWAETKITDEQWSDLCEYGNHQMDWGQVTDEFIDQLNYIIKPQLERNEEHHGKNSTSRLNDLYSHVYMKHRIRHSLLDL